MSILKFLGKRLALSIFVLFGLSLLIFTITRVLPGDPVRLALGPRAPEWAVENLRAQMHLDRPLYVQYYYWLYGALHGDLGQSLYTRRSVVDDVKEFLPATGELALFAGIIMGTFGILLGAISGRYSNTWIDNSGRVFSYFGVATPSFVFAILFLLLFGYILHWFPTAGRLSPGIPRPPVITGMVTVDALITGHFAAFVNALWHMVLPAVSLALGGMAQESRITRSTVSDNLHKDYIASAKGFGTPEWLITLKYLLRPSLIPTVSIYGLDFASLLGNAFLVEMIFNWPGFSRYGINVMLRKDLNAITAVVMVMGVVIILANMVVDLIVAWLDPRIRVGAKRG